MNHTIAAPAPATEKQVDFINKLIAERDPENTNVKAVKALMSLGVTFFDKRTASACIDTLLKVKAKAPAKVETSDIKAIVLEPGVYDTMPEKGDEFLSGRFYIAYTTKYGTIAVKRLYKSWQTKSGYSWQKASLFSLKSLVSKQKATKLDAATAGALGKKFGMCMFCGLTLTDPQSINFGYGPVCATKYGLPH